MAFVHKRLRKDESPERLQFDKFVDLIAFISPAIGIPQVIEVYQGDSTGVSLLYWLGTATYALIFLIYGIKRKVEPMIIVYSLWSVINFLIIFKLIAS